VEWKTCDSKKRDLAAKMRLALSVMPEEATTFGLQTNCSETHIVQLTHLSIWGISDPTAGNGGVQDIQKYSLAIFVEFTESEYRSKNMASKLTRVCCQTEVLHELNKLSTDFHEFSGQQESGSRDMSILDLNSANNIVDLCVKHSPLRVCLGTVDNGPCTGS